MSDSSKVSYSYVTKSSNILSIIFGSIISLYSIYILNNSLSGIILGVGIGMISFSIYELIYSQIIKKNKDFVSVAKIDFLDKYIPVSKYNTPLGVLIGLSFAYVGISIFGGFIGMVLFGFGVSSVGNINRCIYGAEKNPLF